MEIFERIYSELKHEVSSIWYISDEYGSKIMIKVPSNVARSLINGCRISFLFGKDDKHPQPIFHTGVRIYDDPIHFITISGTNRFKDEHTSLEKIMRMDKVVMQVYNELNACIATITASFNSADTERVLKLIGNANDIYTGTFDQTLMSSLNCFDYTFDKSRNLPGVYELKSEIIECSLSEFAIMKNNFIGVNEQGKVTITDNEGEVFEKLVWTPLQSLFDFDIFRNPKIKDKNGAKG